MAVVAILIALCSTAHGTAQEAKAPNVLIVTAHPDDESAFAGTVYKITHDLGGNVDLALITNGEGGYKYSTLAEAIYGVELTNEEIGRQYLPAIRKRELMAGGDIIGIRNYFFLDQKDHKYTLNVDSTLRYVWNMVAVRNRLTEIMNAGNYDYVFCLLPTEDTHGHHKGASILALMTVRDLRAERKPVVLGATVSSKDDTTQTMFTELPNYPVTRVSSGGPIFSFDRTQKFGYKYQLDYKIVVNWLIAEHKSQGTMQTLMNRGDIENFWFFDMNDPKRIVETQALFQELRVNRYKTLEY